MTQKNKKQNREGLWKLTPPWKSAQNADSHRGLKKPRILRAAFSQFPQARRRPFYLNDVQQPSTHIGSFFPER